MAAQLTPYLSPPSPPRTEPDWLGLCAYMEQNSQQVVRILSRELRLYQRKQEHRRLPQRQRDKMNMIAMKLREAEDLLARWKILHRDAVMEREEDLGLRERFESETSSEGEIEIDEDNEDGESVGEEDGGVEEEDEDDNDHNGRENGIVNGNGHAR